MKLVDVRYEERFGVELTFDELFILNWALSDYMIWLSHCLALNKEMPPIVTHEETYKNLDEPKRSELESRLTVGSKMKEMMEAMLY